MLHKKFNKNEGQRNWQEWLNKGSENTEDNRIYPLSVLPRINKITNKKNPSKTTNEKHPFIAHPNQLRILKDKILHLLREIGQILIGFAASLLERPVLYGRVRAWLARQWKKNCDHRSGTWKKSCHEEFEYGIVILILPRTRKVEFSVGRVI